MTIESRLDAIESKLDALLDASGAEPDVLTVDQVADRLAISTRYLSTLIKERVFTVPKCWWIDKPRYDRVLVAAWATSRDADHAAARIAAVEAA